MQVYLVGGAVRDHLLGEPVHERDWVVVGSSAKEMLALGYQQVGKDFPVFLHPQTHEEYALARTERKTAAGYHGFSFDAEAVTLEQDLARRDLTINAIAQTPEGDLIDPYHGQADLENGLLRHVSMAFIEDPVRILRIARFAARFAHYGFKVAHSTHALMQQMVKNGEVDALVPERVWQEMHKTLKGKNPARFFDVLHACGALAVILPPLNCYGNSTGHGKQAANRWGCLNQVSEQLPQALHRFCALVIDLDIDALLRLNQLLRLPKAYSSLAKLLIQQQQAYKNALKLDAKFILQLLKQSDVLRRSQRFFDFLTVAEACFPDTQAQAQYLRQAYRAMSQIKAADFIQQGLKGREIAEALSQAQLLAIQQLIKPSP